MREVTGSTWTFQLIVLFILIFACFLTLVLNYSKAYDVKNNMLTIVEKYEGITTESLEILNNYLSEKSYRTRGNCPIGWYGAVDLDGTIEEVQDNKNYYFCFTEELAYIETEDDKDDKVVKTDIYYNVRLFYKFNLPVLGELTTFEVNGRTNSFIGSDDRIGAK